MTLCPVFSRALFERGLNAEATTGKGGLYKIVKGFMVGQPYNQEQGLISRVRLWLMLS